MELILHLIHQYFCLSYLEFGEGGFNMQNKYDKNGNELKGATVWTRTIKEAGGLEGYNKVVARAYFDEFLNSNPAIADGIAEGVAKERRKKIKLA